LLANLAAMLTPDPDGMPSLKRFRPVRAPDHTKPSTYAENREAALPIFGKPISLLPLLKSEVCQTLKSSSAKTATF
jgi:hypothetical protein